MLRRVATHWPAARLIGIDPAEGMVKQARRLTPGAIIHVSMAESLPLDDGSVDLVLSTASFHHWRDQVQGVKQVARVLRPGGIFVLADISMPYRLQKNLPTWQTGESHYSGQDICPSRAEHSGATTGAGSFPACDSGLLWKPLSQAVARVTIARAYVLRDPRKFDQMRHAGFAES